MKAFDISCEPNDLLIQDAMAEYSIALQQFQEADPEYVEVACLRLTRAEKLLSLYVKHRKKYGN